MLLVGEQYLNNSSHTVGEVGKGNTAHVFLTQPRGEKKKKKDQC